MRQLTRIAAAVNSEPWYLAPTYMETIQDQLHNALNSPKMDADDPVGPMRETYDGKKYPLANQVEIFGDIAVLPMHGVIGKYLSSLAVECGGLDLELAHQQLDNIANDPNVRAVVLDLDTPGGTARGVPKFAAAVAALAEQKPVVAFAKNMMASAGYFIAAGASMIVTTDDCIVGSISTVLAGIDDHKSWAEKGLERKLFVTGQYKAIGMSGTKWTEEQVAYITERTNKCDAEFKGFVSSQRNLPVEMMQGQTWEAREVVGTLVDETTESLETLLIDFL